jgi:hypothetical protein
MRFFFHSSGAYSHYEAGGVVNASVQVEGSPGDNVPGLARCELPDFTNEIAYFLCTKSVKYLQYISCHQISKINVEK